MVDRNEGESNLKGKKEISIRHESGSNLMKFLEMDTVCSQPPPLSPCWL